MVFESLSYPFIALFNFIKPLILIIYAFILITIFFLLQLLFILFYIKLAKLSKTGINIVKSWFDLNKDRLETLINHK